MTRDTQAIAGFALAPWTRDVGQMVVSPGDLYSILERPVLQMHMRDGLVHFGDRDDDYDLPALGAPYERRWPDFLGDDFSSSRKAAGGVDWVKTILVGTAMTLASAPFDKDAFNYAERQPTTRWMKTTVKVGDALPLAARRPVGHLRLRRVAPAPVRRRRRGARGGRGRGAQLRGPEVGRRPRAPDRRPRQPRLRARQHEGRVPFLPVEAYCGHVGGRDAVREGIRHASGSTPSRRSPTSRASAAASTGCRTRSAARCWATCSATSPGSRGAIRGRAKGTPTVGVAPGKLTLAWELP